MTRDSSRSYLSSVVAYFCALKVFTSSFIGEIFIGLNLKEFCSPICFCFAVKPLVLRVSTGEVDRDCVREETRGRVTKRMD